MCMPPPPHRAKGSKRSEASNTCRRGNRASGGADLSAPLTTRPALVSAASHATRLALLACAGLLIEIAWVAVWTLSYRLTHGDGFSYQFLVAQTPVWEKLQETLVLANTLAPGV